MPKITIALITYNRPYYLKQAIEGVLHQTYTDYELIIMDNGSTTETLEQIKPYLNKQVKYHRNEANRIEYVNKAISLAMGEYLIITHDDDIMMPEMLEKEVKLLEENLDTILVACNIKLMNINSQIENEKYFDLNTNINFNQYEFINYYFNSKFFLPCPTVLMRLDLIKKNKIEFRMDAGPACDSLFWIEANSIPYRTVFLHEPLYKYRTHLQQDSRNFICQEAIMIKHFLSNHFQSIKNNLPYYTKRNIFLALINKILLQFYHRKITNMEFYSELNNIKKLMRTNAIAGYDLKLNIKLYIQPIYLFIKRILKKYFENSKKLFIQSS